MQIPKLAFRIDNPKEYGKVIEVYGSSLEAAKKYFYDFDLVISLEELYIPKLNWFNRILSRIGIIDIPNRIEIYWPDYGIPDLGIEQWKSLQNIVTSGEYKKILIHCHGGLGRTGTALSILYGRIFKDIDPIEYIRTAYGYKAVETMRQEEYVWDMAELDKLDKLERLETEDIIDILVEGE
jgi:protein-tyrosine phosphatase